LGPGADLSLGGESNDGTLRLKNKEGENRVILDAETGAKVTTGDSGSAGRFTIDDRWNDHPALTGSTKGPGDGVTGHAGEMGKSGVYGSNGSGGGFGVFGRNEWLVGPSAERRRHGGPR